MKKVWVQRATSVDQIKQNVADLIAGVWRRACTCEASYEPSAVCGAERCILALGQGALRGVVGGDDIRQISAFLMTGSGPRGRSARVLGYNFPTIECIEGIEDIEDIEDIEGYEDRRLPEDPMK
jgi:hypothetical protein